MQINRAASMQLESIPASAPVAHAAKKMKDSNVGLLLVADGTRLVGVVTDRDIVTRAAAEGRPFDDTPVRVVMSSPVVTIHGDEDLQEAAKLMVAKRVRRLVVTNDRQEPVGVLSLDDLAFSTHGDDTAGAVLEEIAAAPPSSALFRGA